MLDKALEVKDLSPDALDDHDTSGDRHTVTRRELARSLFVACDRLAHRQAATLVDQVLEEISETLIKGENVTLCNFGKFVIVEKKERKGRNPRTGDFALVKPRKVVSFRASKYLKSIVSKTDAAGC
ncbi:MAG: HU family DNA-binding protein [Methylocystis sp.]|uniref:HU family DNA-binding protein n=1 Tax=Methylocystis sp. TaxID=1911079 RepID=UPI003DA4E0F2